MRQEKTDRILKYLFYILSVICMCVIFWLSSMNSNVSSQQSGFVLELLYKLFGNSFFTVFIVRKGAHCLEFTGLSLLMCSAVFFSSRKIKTAMLGVAFTSLYAISDEVHQLFVSGRSCEFRDWMIDTLGAIAGGVVFLIIALIISKIRGKNKRKNIDTKNI